MCVSSAVSDYFRNTSFKQWQLSDCLSHVTTECLNLTSECKQDIIDEFKSQLLSIANNKCVYQVAKNKALKLYGNVENFFNLKETITLFAELDVKVSSIFFFLFGFIFSYTYKKRQFFTGN